MARSPLSTVLIAACLLGAALATGCPNQSKNDAIKRANAGAKALGARQYDTAIAELKESVRLDKDNANAYFMLGEAYGGKKVWPEAVEAYENAVRIRPSDPMYHMRLGTALYDEAVTAAIEAEANRLKKKPEEVSPDWRSINFDSSLQHLETAVKSEPELYRAHFYIGRIHRALGRDQQAAEAFTKSIQAWPRFAQPYIALAELYRRWDYPNEAIQVVSQGVEYVMEPQEKSELYYELGMAYFDKLDDGKAIEAFSNALDRRKDNFNARFQRGLAYFRKGDLKAADKDLEDFAKTAGPTHATNKTSAQKIRFQIAAKQQGG